MAVKFLDFTGVQKLWAKIRATFVAKNSTEDVTVGSVSVKGSLHLYGDENTSSEVYCDEDGAVVFDGDVKFASGVTVNGFAIPTSQDVDVVAEDLARTSQEVGVVTENLARFQNEMEESIAELPTKTYVAEAVANAGHLKREKVSALPGVSTAKENVIYMVSNSTTGDNKFDEYMLIDGAWEKTGSSDVDLTGYANTPITDDDLATLT